MEMCHFILKVFTIVVLISTLSHCVSATSTVTKTKRGGGGALGLYPFPRNGRSGAYARIPSEGYDSSEMFHEMKRQNLMAFPRVGRGDNRPQHVELDNGAMNGLWWGPRLGRVQKRGMDYATEGPWAIISLRDFHLPTPRDIDYTPRLGRESEEDVEENTEFTDDVNRSN